METVAKRFLLNCMIFEDLDMKSSSLDGESHA